MSPAAAARVKSMSSVTCQISISFDGFVAGPNQSLENPIGEGGMRLHEWAFRTRSWRAQQGLQGGEDSDSSRTSATPPSSRSRSWRRPR